MAETLFGLIGSLDADITCAILISLIVFLFLFETGLEILDEFATDAGYEDLLRRLYKEMMMMGFVSFGLFIAFNAFTVEHDEKYFAFEFAHITTFFIAIFFVLRAVLLVHYSKLAKQLFWRAHNETVLSVYEEYTRIRRFPWSWEAIKFKYLGVFSRLRQNIEYLVLEDYFYKTYKLRLEEFRFVDYLSKSYKFYTIDLTEIVPLTWLALIALVLINFARVKLVGDWHINDICSSQYNHNDDHHDDDHRRLASEGDDNDSGFAVNHTCVEYIMGYVLVCGFALVLFSLILALVSTMYKNRLLAKAGLSSDVNIVPKLWDLCQNESDSTVQSFEDISKVNSKLDVEEGAARCLPCSSKKTSHSPVRVARICRHHDDNLRSVPDDQRASQLYLGDGDEETYFVCTLRVALESMKEKKERHHHHVVKKVLHMITSAALIVLWPCGGVRDRGLTEPQVNEKLRELKKNIQETRRARRRGHCVHEPTLDCVSDASTICEDDRDDSKHPLLREINSVFVNQDRFGYKFVIQLSLMLDSFFLALWATNFITLANHSNNRVLYNVLLIIPIILLAVLNSYNMIVSSIIFSITSLRNKGAEYICEQDDIKRKILPVVRKEIMKLLPDGDDTTVEELYNIIDSNSGGKNTGIDKMEFASFLHTLDLHPTEKEIRALFRAMDSDGSGTIELNELKDLLYDPGKSLPPNEIEQKSIHTDSKPYDDTTNVESTQSVELTVQSNGTNHL